MEQQQPRKGTTDLKLLSILSHEIFLKSPDTDLIFPDILVFFGSKKDLIPFLGPINIFKLVKPTFDKGQRGKSTPYRN